MVIKRFLIKTIELLGSRLKLDDKKIAVIGNANSLFEKKLGNVIDSYDIVFRLNKGFQIRDAEHQGKKVTVVATSVPLDLSSQEKKIKLLWVSPARKSVPLKWLIFFRVRFLPKNNWDKLFHQLNARPSTGIMLVDYLVRRSGAKEICLFGFDGFKTKSFYEDRISEVPHDFASEIGLLESYLKEDRIKWMK